MRILRIFFLRHRAMAFAVIALAMAMKVMIPAGTMIGGDARALTIQICDGYADAAHDTALAVVIAVKGHGDTGKSAPDHQACPFSALGHAGLTGADPVLLAAALAFILLLGLAAPIFSAPRALFRLRPPLRAPPALA
jgi:hypothetical protein